MKQDVPRSDHCHKSITDPIDTVKTARRFACANDRTTQRAFWRIWVGICVWPVGDVPPSTPTPPLWEGGGCILNYPFAHLSIMHLVCPPKFCINVVLNFSWDHCNTQEKLKTKIMQSFLGRGGRGQTRCIMGDVEMANSLWLRRSLIRASVFGGGSAIFASIELLRHISFIC